MSTSINKRAKELGLKKMEATRPLTLQVKAMDVKRASKKDPNNCAFSRACKRQYPGIKAAYFFRTTAWLEYPDRIVRYSIPLSMQKEIVAFDRNKTMEPGEYRLSKVPKNWALADQRKRDVKRRSVKRNANGRSGRTQGLRRHFTTDIRGHAI